MNDQTLRYSMRKKFSRYQTNIKDLGTLVYMGTPDGLVTVPNRPGFVYVMSNDAAPTEVFNKRIQPVLGLPVIVGYDPAEPWLYQVLSVHTQGSTSESGGSQLFTQVPAHADNHAVLGSDPVWIDKRQILDARVGPTVGLSIEVRPTVLRFGNTLVPVAFQEIDLTAHVPASGSSLYALVAVNSSGSVVITVGAAVAGQTPLSSAAPAVPTGQIGLAYVRLYGGQVEIYEGPEYTDILDIRTVTPYIAGGNPGDIEVIDTLNNVSLYPGTEVGLQSAITAAPDGSYIYIPPSPNTYYNFNSVSGSVITITDKSLTFVAKVLNYDTTGTVNFTNPDRPALFNITATSARAVSFIGCVFDIRVSSNASGSVSAAIATTTGNLTVTMNFGQVVIASNYAGSKAYLINSSGSGAISFTERNGAVAVSEEAGANSELVNAPVGAAVTIIFRSGFLNAGKSSYDVNIRNTYVSNVCSELIASAHIITPASVSDRSSYLTKIYHAKDLHDVIPTYHVPEPSAVNKTIRSSGSPVRWVEIDDPSVLTRDPTGFASPASVVINYDPTARTVTLTGTIAAYWAGSPVPGLVSGSFVSGSHPATNGQYFYSFNGTSFVWSTTVWTFDQLQIAFVNYGATDKYAIRECHGFMPWQAHEEFHDTIGTYKESGGTLSGYTLLSSTATDRRPDVSATVIHDEDILTTNAALTSKLYTKAFLSGSGITNYTVETAEIVPLLVNNPYYNLFSTPNWTQVLMANNSYMSVWLVGVPVTASTTSQKYRYLWIQGQSNGTLAAQQALTPASLNLGQLGTEATEFVFLVQVILRYQGGNWDIQSVTNLSGSKFIQTSNPAGNFLSIVTTDTTLSGAGTVASPLGVVWASGSGVFVQKSGDTMTGALTLPSNGLIVGTTQLVVSGGNVGIGTTAPPSKLSIHDINGPVTLALSNFYAANYAQTDAVLAYISGKGGLQAEPASFGGMKIITDAVTWYKGRLGFFTNNVDGTDPANPATEKMTILANGNVGIGDAAPGELLDVAGNINSTGVYKVDDVQVVGNQGAAVADATDAASVILRLNDLLARLRTHGLIAT